MTRASGALAWIVSVIVLVLILNAGMAAWSFTRPVSTDTPLPLDTAWPTPFVRPSPTPTIAPTASPTPAPLLLATPLGTLPDDHVFVFVGDPGDQRLLLLDLGAGAVREAAHVQPGGTTDFDSTRSADSSTIAIVGRGNEVGRLVVLHPGTGALATFQIPVVESARISPDGRLIAVTRVDAAQRGIWLIDTTDGRIRSLALDPVGPTPPRTLGWSGDGTRIAVAFDSNSTAPHIGVVAMDGTVEQVGTGRGARWRGADLLYWSALKGTPVNAYSTLTHQTQPLLPVEADAVVYSAEPRPGTTDLATQEQSAAPISRIVLHSGADAREVLADASHVITYWWSRDGAHLYTWIDDQNTETVRDVLADRDVLRFCLRKTTAPPCS